jgi:hypothetical protein
MVLGLLDELNMDAGRRRCLVGVEEEDGAVELATTGTASGNRSCYSRFCHSEPCLVRLL